jgi:hypothetical protein
MASQGGQLVLETFGEPRRRRLLQRLDESLHRPRLAAAPRHPVAHARDDVVPMLKEAVVALERGRILLCRGHGSTQVPEPGQPRPVRMHAVHPDRGVPTVEVRPVDPRRIGHWPPGARDRSGPVLAGRSDVDRGVHRGQREERVDGNEVVARGARTRERRDDSFTHNVDQLGASTHDTGPQQGVQEPADAEPPDRGGQVDRRVDDLVEEVVDRRVRRHAHQGRPGAHHQTSFCMSSRALARASLAEDCPTSTACTFLERIASIWPYCG